MKKKQKMPFLKEGLFLKLILFRCPCCTMYMLKVIEFDLQKKFLELNLQNYVSKSKHLLYCTVSTTESFPFIFLSNCFFRRKTFPIINKSFPIIIKPSPISRFNKNQIQHHLMMKMKQK